MANGNPLCDDLFTRDGVLCDGAEATRSLARAVAERIEPRSVVSLEGPLGAGKTLFAKALVTALGGDDAASPTFGIVNEYAVRGGRVFHWDFYRLRNADEAWLAGFDDALADGIVLVEWGDLFPELLPSGAWRMRFEVAGPDLRRIIGVVRP